MTHAAIPYALGAVGLLCGVAVALVLLRTDEAEAGAFQYLLVIPAFAGLSYLLMAGDVGSVVVDGYALPVPRYVDWLVTTPILVGYVGYVAGAERKWIVGTAAADAAMILFGLGAALVPGSLTWVLFGLSGLCHLSLLYALYAVFPRPAAERSYERRQLFRVLQNHVGLLWLAYPVVWLAGPAGLGYVSALGLVLVVTYLDVVAKTPYVYFVWRHRSAFGEDSAVPVTTDDDSSEGAPAAVDA